MVNAGVAGPAPHPACMFRGLNGQELCMPATAAIVSGSSAPRRLFPVPQGWHPAADDDGSGIPNLNVFAVDTWLPPASLGLTALLLLLLGRRGRTLGIVALGLLVLLSLPIVSLPLMAALDVEEPPAADQPVASGTGPGAIVILSADVQRTAIPGLAEIGPLTLERERAGAALARRTGLPVLVTGGLVTAPPPVGALMAASLATDFGVPVRWAETRSGTTWENATMSVPLLRASGIDQVYVVTHAWHMRRALLAFRRAGMKAVAAPVRQDLWPTPDADDLLPRTTSWERSARALHEWVGLLYYATRS